MEKYNDLEGMYLVYTNDGEKHSAWETVRQAEKQIRTLKENGYKGVYIDFDATVKTENGHYYI